MIPFWTNFLVRTYAFKQVLAGEGGVNAMLQALGAIAVPVASGRQIVFERRAESKGALVWRRCVSRPGRRPSSHPTRCHFVDKGGPRL